MQFNIKSLVPHIAAVVIFLVLSIFYFSPQFSGKSIYQSDMIAYKGMAQEIRAHLDETGERSLWTNAMFGGMPAYQINTVTNGNLLSSLVKPSRFFLKEPAGNFIAAMVSFYIFAVIIGLSPWLGILGAIGFGFATNNLILFEAGHMNKLKAISYLPLMASGILLAFRNKYVLGGLLFGMGAGLDIASNHIQMTYYFFLTIIIWGVVEFVKSIANGTLINFSKAVGALLIGGILALGATASNIWISYEYSQDTMRGKPILETNASTNASSSSVDGLDWNYAMNWSNSTLDVFSSYIPGLVGGGSAQPTTSSSPYGKALNKLGARISGEFDAPLYWGGLPFTSGPAYFGAVMIFFFIVGLFLVEGPVKWWLGLGTLLTILLSMGSNLEGFNRIFFDYFPLFNKFRTPNSVLSITSFLIPALAILSLHNIITSKSSKEDVLKSLYIGGGIAAATALFFALAGTSFFDFSSPADADRLNRAFGGQLTPDMLTPLVSSLQETRAELMQSDSIRTLILVLLSGGLTYLFVQNKIKSNVLIIALGALTVFDLFGVGMRYLNKDDFKRNSEIQNTFKPRAVDEQILKDPALNYRVYDATIPTFESAQSSYFHKTIGGYHAAKLQRYQDMIDHHFSKGNQAALDMLNTKYFILPAADGSPGVQTNPNALGNAWFIDSLVTVNTNNEEIDALDGFNPKKTAIVHKEFSGYLSNTKPSGNGTITLTSYKPNELVYSSQTQQEELAVFSEVWYGPNKGWQAYIDGQAVDHIRVNYVLRAMKIPSGKHEIVFKFEPATYASGIKVSFVSSLLLVAGLLGFLWISYKNGPPKEVTTETVKKKEVKKKSKK